MSDDIVSRLLRTQEVMAGNYDESHYLDCREAAAEIERLRGYRDEAEAEAAIASLAAKSLMERLRQVSEEPGGLKTHSPDQCDGEHCCIHNPSQHHMSAWPMRWRADKGQMERICEHGIGHPDPDDAAYRDRMGQGYRNIHGCDGCCRPTSG